MIDGGRAINANTTRFELSGEGIEQFIGPVDCMLRTHAMLAAHVTVFWYLCIQCRLFGRNMAIVCTPHNHMFERIPFIPAIHYGFVHQASSKGRSQTMA